MIDGYLLQEVIGEGTSGVVHLAVTSAGDRAAVKILRPERMRDATARARFVREARLMTEVESRHVVPILSVGETEETVYLVMPFYGGGSLAGKGPLPVAEVVPLASQIARGLDALHRRSIVHRDVKPSNVLLANDGTAALTDFGLALAADSTRVTDTGMLLGTPHYLAPELIAGGDATKQSDIYALGCVLYELIGGQPPFADATRPTELTFAHLVELVPEIRGVPADVNFALQSALAKEPRERPTSATALARMLYLAHRPAPA